MKLIEALEILGRPVPDGAPELRMFVACGFTPLHLQTFLGAELRERFPKHEVEIATGLFGDLIGNVERLELSSLDRLVVVLEWTDLDPRLGVRRLGGWRPSNLLDIVDSVERAAARLLQVLSRFCRSVSTVVSMPTLPLAPLFWTAPGRGASSELHVHQIGATLAKSLSELPGVQVVNSQLLGELSPLGLRFDLRSEVSAGFPYSLQHASAISGLLAGLIENRPPKKGLITDLDDTLWGGILGEEGPQGVSWDLEHRTHMHGLYQQVAASLAGAGVLIGVASKNDPAIVETAFERSDLLISKSDIFPFEVHWSRKSESVKRILDSWNVGAESVVFIDDSPMEVAEVKASFPEMECIVFPKSDYRGIFDLVKHLRDAFGKRVLTEDDGLRLSSIRNASMWRDSIQSTENASDEFLRAAEGSIVFSLGRDSGDARALELVNKTNQFNLNGKRFTESEWRTFRNDPASLIVTVSYKDKYGPLGTIAVILGRTNGSQLHIPAWVMSCRAFSRRIEYQCLKWLFETRDIHDISFDYKATPRNGPLQEFFGELLGSLPLPGISLSREQFELNVPDLFHDVKETINV